MDKHSHPFPTPAWTEKALLALFRALIRLYPAPFRGEFGGEIGDVFGDALAARRAGGIRAQAALMARELAGLPAALLREYRQSTPEANRPGNPERQAIMRSSSVRSAEHPSRPYGWREVFLAVLPYLLVMLNNAAGLPAALGWLTAEQARWLQIPAIIVTFGAAAACVVLLVRSWRRKTRPLWAASWYTILTLLGAALAFLLPVALFEALGIDLVDSQGVFIYLFIPLVIAALLYGLTRFDPLHGLLGVMPLAALIWHMYNEEFVPQVLIIALSGLALAIICLAVAFVMRRGDWRVGLLALLGANLVVGLIYAYAGIYHGGTLPSVAAGPSPLEVVRSLIPQVLATSALFLGPLFARRFRLLGRAASTAIQPGASLAPRRSNRARAFARLAQGSLLLITLTYLAALMMGMEPPDFMESALSQAALSGLLIVFAAGYLLGTIGLARERSGRAGAQHGSTGRLVDGVLLPLLALGLPLALVFPLNSGWKWPVSKLALVPLMWSTPDALLFAIGLGWLALSTWVVLQEVGMEGTGDALAVDGLPVG